MSIYKDCDVNIHGGSSTYVASGDSIVHNHGSRPGLKQLQEHVAANALHNSGEVSDQPKCHPGTRVAILDHLIAWAVALTYAYPVTWLHGPAGSGKSSILRTIAQMLFDQKILLASFFFFRTAPGRNSSDRFIATISYQVARSIPATRPHIEDAIEENPLIFSFSLWDQAQALIISPILAIRDGSTLDSNQFPRIIIVDGLDECNDPDKQCEILDVLCRAFQKLPIPFAVLVASRPEHHIRGAFDLGDLNRRSSRLSLDDSYQPDADIKKFLFDRFNNIQQHHPFRTYLPTSWPLQAVIDKLVASASGQFIYASTVNKFVSSIRHNPADRLDIVLGILDRGKLKPFEQLDVLYSTIFHTIDPDDLAGALLVLGGFLVPYSTEPPSPRFLERLLGLGNGGVRRLLFDLESLLTIGSDDEDIRFFHASLSDYLFDKSRSGQFWIDAGMVYADLAEQCLSYSSKSTGWMDFNQFFVNNISLLFSKATPTLCLHEAIKNCDMGKVVRNYGHEQSVIFLQAIRDPKFSNVEDLYRVQQAAYARIVEPKIRVYLQDTLAHYAFITVFLVNLAWHSFRDLKHIFRLSRAMLVNDKKLGFGILSDLKDSPRQNAAIKDLLEDPKGNYFVDGDQYTDIALYLTKCMTEDSESYVTPGPRVGVLSDIGRSMANIFPIIISKSSIRHDLIEYIKSTSLSPSYLKYTSISDAITSYISRSEAGTKNGPQSQRHDEPEPSQSVVKVNQTSDSSTEGALTPGSRTHLTGARRTPNVEKPNVKKPLTHISKLGYGEKTGRDSLLDGKSMAQTKTNHPPQSMAVSPNQASGSRIASSRSLQIPAKATSIAGSRDPGTRTPPAQRASPVPSQRPTIKKPTFRQDDETASSGGSKEFMEPDPTHGGVPLASARVSRNINKTGHSSVASSEGTRTARRRESAPANVLRSAQVPSWK